MMFGIMAFLGYIFTKDINIWKNKVMKKQKKRVKMVNEIFNNIKVIKMNGWEELFNKRLDKVRSKELKNINRYYKIISSTFSIMLLTSNNVIFSVFCCYVWLGGTLDTALCFGIIVSFLVLWNPMRTCTIFFIYYLDALNSIKKI